MMKELTCYGSRAATLCAIVLCLIGCEQGIPRQYTPEGSAVTQRFEIGDKVLWDGVFKTYRDGTVGLQIPNIHGKELKILDIGCLDGPFVCKTRGMRYKCSDGTMSAWYLWDCELRPTDIAREALKGADK